MIVREDRIRAADAIARYMRGEIDNFALDDALAGYRGGDTAIHLIGLNLWFSYDDLKRHSVCVTREGWRTYRRCIAFLLSDLDTPKPQNKQRAASANWPYLSAGEIIRQRPRLDRFGLPMFDPAKHNFEIRSGAEQGLMWLNFWLMVLVLLAGAWEFLCWLMG